MAKRDGKSFKRGQRLLRKVGNKVMPVTFLMPGPRLGQLLGTDTITHDSQTAIVVQEDGAVIAVPVDELKLAE